MIILLIFFQVQTAKISQPIPEYIISSGEEYYLPLYDYFSGDFLAFNSSGDGTGLTLKNNSISMTKEVVYSFEKVLNYTVTSILSTLEYNSTSYYIVISRSSLLLFELSNTSNVISECNIIGDNSNFEEIIRVLALKVSSSNFQILVFYISKVYQEYNENYFENSFKIINFSSWLQKGNCNDDNKTINDIDLWDVKYAYKNFAIEIPNLVVGSSNSMLIPMIYYKYDKGNVYIYNFTNYTYPGLHSFMNFSGEAPEDGLVYDNYLYIITNKYKIFCYSLDDLINPYAITYADDFAPLLKLQISLNGNSIIITTNSAFITLSTPDLQRVYYKNVNSQFLPGFIHRIIELPEYNVFVQNLLEESVLFISQNSSYFNILQKFQISKSINLQWTAFQYSSYNIKVISADKNRISMITFQISQAMIMVNDTTNGEFLIRAYDSHNPDDYAELPFKVNQTSSGILTIYNTSYNPPYYNIQCNGLSFTWSANCYDFFSAPNLTCEISDINYSKNNIDTIDPISYPAIYNDGYKMQVPYLLPFMISYQNFVIFFNSSNAMFYSLETLKNISDVKAFQFTNGVCKMFVNENYIYALHDCNKDSSTLSIIQDVYTLSPGKSISLTSPNVSVAFTGNRTLVVTFQMISVYSLDLLYHYFDMLETEIMAFSSYNNFIYTLQSHTINIQNLLEASYMYEMNVSYVNTSYLYANADYLILYNKTTAALYDTSSYKEIKTLNFTEPWICMSMSNNTIVTIEGNNINLYNLDNFIYNSLIGTYPLDYIPNNCTIIFNEMNTNLSVIADSNFMIIDYNPLGSSIGIASSLFSNISVDSTILEIHVNISAYASKGKINATSSFSVQLDLNINGLTYNLINISSDNITLSCDGEYYYNLDNAITGQNISFFTETKDTPIQLSQIIEKTGNNSYNGLHFFFSDDYNLTVSISDFYIFINNETVFPLDTCSYSKMIFISLKYLSSFNQSLYFFTGSYNETYYNDYWKGNSSLLVQNSQYFLTLWSYNPETQILNSVRTSSIFIRPDKIRVVALNSLDFILFAFNTFPSTQPNMTYKNVVYIFKNDLYPTPIEFTILGINTIYVSDIVGIYDPMFNHYYVYIADINFGIRIFQVIDTLILEKKGLVQLDQSVACLALSYPIMYVTTESTNVYKYFVTDFVKFEIIGIIYAINEGYSPLPATMILDKYYEASYLAQIIYNSSSSYFLQVINLNSPSTSNILTEYYLTNETYNFSLAFQHSNSILVFYKEQLFRFVISPGSLSLNCSNKHDNKIDTYDYNVTAYNQYYNVNIPFIIKVTKDHYQSGSLGNSLNISIILIIAGGSTGFLIVILLAWKKYFRRAKNKINASPGLFIYDFYEIEKEVSIGMIVDDKDNLDLD